MPKWTALDADPQTLDEHEARFVANIGEHGWYRTSVLGEEDLPAFSYTTGFWHALGFPEIIVFSLKSETAHAVFWDIFKGVRAGRHFQFGKRIAGVLDNFDIALLPVDKRHYREHLGWSSWFYAGDDFPCAQLVWPDRANLFPWEEGFAADYARAQPNLTEGDWAPDARTR